MKLTDVKEKMKLREVINNEFVEVIAIHNKKDKPVEVQFGDNHREFYASEDLMTEEQEKLMETLPRHYEAIMLSGDDSYDVEKIRRGIDFIYDLSNLKSPKIVICPSPMDMVKVARLKKGEAIDCFGCGYDFGRTAFYDYMQQIGVEYDKSWGFDKWKEFLTESGIFFTILYEYVVFVCIRPCEVHRTPGGELHNESGPAIRWRDGYVEYALNGVFINKDIVMTPAEQLDVKLVFQEKNAERRREIVRKIGIERIIQKTGATVLDKWNEYELLQLPQMEGMTNKPVYLKMRNPSIGTWHVEGVPHTMQTVGYTQKKGTNGHYATENVALHFRKPPEMQSIPVNDNGLDWYQQGDVVIYPKGAPSLKPYPTKLT